MRHFVWFVHRCFAYTPRVKWTILHHLGLLLLAFLSRSVCFFCTVNIIVFTSFDIIGCCRVLFSPCSCVYVALRISQNEQIWPQCPNCIRNATFVCLYIYDLQKHQQRICQCNINDMLPCYTIVDRDGGQGWEKPFYVPFHAPNG